jgi:hypothetical protein
MKTSKFLAAAALALVAVTGAQAETYDGVHPLVSGRSRADVEAEAVQAAAAKDQNVTRGSRGPETVAVSQDRAKVQAEAVRAAAAPDQNVTSGSRYNSKVISTLPNPVDARAEAAKANASKM